MLTIVGFDKKAEFQYVDNFNLKNFSHPLLSIEEPWYSMKYDKSYDWLIPIIHQLETKDFGAKTQQETMNAIWTLVQQGNLEIAAELVAKCITKYEL